jgi:hypothetical protein
MRRAVVEPALVREALATMNVARILPDEQSHQALSAPRGRGDVVNVAPYGNGIGYGEWTHIDGWSEAVLSYVAAAENVAVVTGAEKE